MYVSSNWRLCRLEMRLLYVVSLSHFEGGFHPRSVRFSFGLFGLVCKGIIQ